MERWFPLAEDPRSGGLRGEIYLVLLGNLYPGELRYRARSFKTDFHTFLNFKVTRDMGTALKKIEPR